MNTTSEIVMAKLAADVWKKVEAMAEVFQKLPEYKEDLYAPFKSFLPLCHGLLKASMYKYLGQSEHKQENYGPAVAYLNAASEALKAVWTPSPGTPLSRFLKEIDEGKEDVEHVKRAFTLDNNHVYFKPVPALSSLAVPEGKCLMTTLGWMPPRPAFEKIYS